MTRETKIGLLVGLAFIIMLGILLSDHLSSTNEPMGAPLRVAGDSLRSGLGQPQSDDVAPVLRAPVNVVPQQQVVTREELSSHTSTPPVRFVSPDNQQAISPGPNSGTFTDKIRQLAQQHGEEIVPAGNNSAISNNTAPDQPQAIETKTAARTYTAEPGDSLGAIATKVYGSGCRANREAIVAANPSLAANRDLVIVGKTYIIPALANAQTKSPATHLPQPAVEKPAPAAGGDLTYIVKPHDTLWSIAMTEVGTPTAVAAIKDLNKDILNGSDALRPDMKLTLPAKKSAQ
jgi:nucleoid-associated protein YgaU